MRLFTITMKNCKKKNLQPYDEQILEMLDPELKKHIKIK